MDFTTSLFALVHFHFKFMFYFFAEILLFHTNSVNPDQTPRSVASDLGLHCLPMTLSLYTRQ